VRRGTGNTKILLEQAFEQSPNPMALVSMPDMIIRIANPAIRESWRSPMSRVRRAIARRDEDELEGLRSSGESISSSRITLTSRPDGA